MTVEYASGENTWPFAHKTNVSYAHKHSPGMYIYDQTSGWRAIPFLTP